MPPSSWTISVTGLLSCLSSAVAETACTLEPYGAVCETDSWDGSQICQRTAPLVSYRHTDGEKPSSARDVTAVSGKSANRPSMPRQ